jgi:DNA-binding transcriptional ArsR family regulator
LATAVRPDRVFAALADSTWRAMLARLAQGETTGLELARPFKVSQPAITEHLRVLERAGLVTRRRQAQRRPVRLAARPLAEADAWLQSYPWCPGHLIDPAWFRVVFCQPMETGLARAHATLTTVLGGGRMTNRK